MSLLELFCDVDDFMLRFVPQWKASHLAAGKQRERAGQLCPSEVMTLLIHFHQSHYRTWKRVLHGTCPGVSDQGISALGELSALCGTHPADDASVACLFADPLWCLHGHQLHRLNFAFCL